MGWYLAGLIVSPPYRRRGIGRKLTLFRIETLKRKGATEVWYFAAAMNRATLDLHQELGFHEVTRDFMIPQVSFTGGVGVLCRALIGAS